MYYSGNSTIHLIQLFGIACHFSCQKMENTIAPAQVMGNLTHIWFLFYTTQKIKHFSLTQFRLMMPKPKHGVNSSMI